ncbi:MAG TPA: outer membrane beta-barrel protein [Gammaproteobacteria bacterium]|nr:outer membrane beta-barrel protein [Gammaproteobacteria bacterium]
MKYLLLAVLSIASLSAYAQERHGAYLGAGLGSFHYKERDVAFSDAALAYQVLGGYRFNKYLAVEGAWGASRDLTESYSELTLLGTATIDLTAHYDRVLTTRAVGILPLRILDLYGALGYYHAHLTGSGTGTLSGYTVQESAGGTDSGATAGVGVQFHFSNMSIRGGYQWFDAESGVDASLLGVEALFHF